MNSIIKTNLENADEQLAEIGKMVYGEKSIIKAGEYFHYTCSYHLATILRTGYLKLSQGILDDVVVWLSKTNHIKQQWQGEKKRVGTTIDKSEIRFVVTGNNIIPWNDYKKRPSNRDTKIKRMWIKLLESKNDHSKWYISEDIIPFENIVSIENTRTGKKIKLEFNALIKNRALSEKEIKHIVNKLS